MPKHLSVKYYQENKERLRKKLVKDIEILLKERKKKLMVVNITKISQKMGNKLVEYSKKYKARKKRFVIIIRKHFNLENFAYLQRKV